MLRLTGTALPWPLQYLVILVVCLSAVFLVGIAFFVLIERPCMDPAWPQKLMGLPPAPAARADLKRLSLWDTVVEL